MGKARTTTLARFLGMVIGLANILANVQTPREMFSLYGLTYPQLAQQRELPQSCGFL